MTSVKDLLGGSHPADSHDVWPAATLMSVDDLDGDGKRDLLSFEHDPERSIERSLVHARRGRDGSILWTLEISYASYFSFHDLTGDRTDEMILLERTGSAAIVPASNATVWSTHGSQTISVIDPLGAILWRRVFDGTTTQAQVVGGTGWVVVKSWTNIVWTVFPEPDVTGDRRADVFVRTEDLIATYLLPGEPSIPPSVSYRRTARGISLRGTDGAESAELVIEGDNEDVGMRPIADVSSDGRTDIVVRVRPREGNTRLGVYPAAGGSPYWERDLGSRSEPHPDLYVLPGLTRSTALLYGFDQDAFDGRVVLSAHAAHDGTFLWRRPYHGFVELAGDADNDGWTDLLEVRIRRPKNKPASMTHLALSGRTGRELWRRSVEGKNTTVELVDCWCVEFDLTGDGVNDVVSGARRKGTPMEPGPVLNSFGLDGATGTRLWRSSKRGSDLPKPIRGSGDVTGNGSQDLGRTRFTRIDDVRSLRINLAEGSTNDFAWDVIRRPFPSRWEATWEAWDVAGGNADELIVVITAYRKDNPPRFLYEVYGRNGLVSCIELVRPWRSGGCERRS